MLPTRTQRHRQRRSSLPSARHNSHASPQSNLCSIRSNSASDISFAVSCTQQSPSFQCLEKIVLEVAVEEEKHPSKPTKTLAVFYVLRVRHATCDVSWSHRLSLTEYLGFQTQLLQILEQGHVCSGDCPWLYSFLASYFPRASSCRFKLLCPKWIAKRRDALALCFTTLHSFLLTRENQSCPVLRRSVLKAFTAFVYGELGASHPLLSKIKISEQLAGDSPGSSRQSTTASEGSSAISSPPSSSSSGTTGDSGSSAGETALLAVPTCALCRSRLDEEAAAFGLPVHPVPPPASTLAPSSSSSRSSSIGSSGSGRYYATKLRCGHEFHEECILVWLNQALSCPLCGRSDLSPRSEERRRGSSRDSIPTTGEKETEGVPDNK